MLDFYRDRYKPLKSMSRYEFQSAYINVKIKVLSDPGTSFTPTVWENRLEGMIGHILENHSYIYNENGLGHIYDGNVFSFKDPIGIIGNQDIEYNDLSEEECLLAFFFLWHGGVRKGKQILPDSKFLLGLFDYLTIADKFDMAYYLYGILLKYGPNKHLPPNIRKSKEMLLEASNRNITFADNELLDIHQYDVFNNFTLGAYSGHTL